MKTALRVLGILLTGVLALGALGLALAFGDCAGWKGTGTCPRVPPWDWEVLRIVFFGTAPLVVAARIRRDRIVRTFVEAAFVAAAIGAVIVWVTAT